MRSLLSSIWAHAGRLQVTVACGHENSGDNITVVVRSAEFMQTILGQERGGMYSVQYIRPRCLPHPPSASLSMRHLLSHGILTVASVSRTAERLYLDLQPFFVHSISATSGKDLPKPIKKSNLPEVEGPKYDLSDPCTY